ncbi:MAG: hypothetical protein ACRDN9_16680 [Streptosporangiaceae bacterium]
MGVDWRERRAVEAEGNDPARPRLRSVGGTDLAAVTVAGLDLRSCRFLGSHNLDGLRVEGDTVFGYAPAGWRWATRRTIAEEHHWRSLYARHRRRAWYLPPYRAGNPSGAAGEYVLLWLYWFFSGYGLRAWRALSAFAVAVLLATAAFTLSGFPATEPHGFGAALRFSLRASVSLLHDDNEDQPLTAAGEWTELALRLIGPLLLGLALISLRGRVKRCPLVDGSLRMST